MAMNPPRESVLDRFLRYVKIDTQSKEDEDRFPSTEKQLDLSRLLVKELKSLGIKDAKVDQYGYVYGTLPSNLPSNEARNIPVVGFISHVDTSPAVSGTDVKPVIHENYQGGDIVLPGDNTQVIRVDEYPNLEKCIGMDIITSDGTTLLGADNKAGIAEIMTAVETLIQNPDIRRGPMKIAFTPDEEVGNGTKHFDVPGFGADYAYTIDGQWLGELEFETFNAFSATMKIEGVGVHPGYAKDKLVNAVKMASEVINRLPKEMTPETTANREGYIHPYLIEGQAEIVTIKMLLRDFEIEGIEKQKTILEGIRAEVLALYPKGRIELETSESYKNMRYKIENEMKIVEYAEEAIRRTGVEPRRSIIRGGTDGATLSYKGLLTPNLFTGGDAFHSKIEWVPVQVMEKSTETIVNLVAIWEEKAQGK
jgi:tripeptide aminopeptidase